MTVTLVVFYGLSFNSGAVEAVSVTPGYFWPPHFWIWTAFTHWDDAKTDCRLILQFILFLVSFPL